MGGSGALEGGAAGGRPAGPAAGPASPPRLPQQLHRLLQAARWALAAAIRAHAAPPAAGPPARPRRLQRAHVRAGQHGQQRERVQQHDAGGGLLDARAQRDFRQRTAHKVQSHVHVVAVVSGSVGRRRAGPFGPPPRQLAAARSGLPPPALHGAQCELQLAAFHPECARADSCGPCTDPAQQMLTCVHPLALAPRRRRRAHPVWQPNCSPFTGA